MKKILVTLGPSSLNKSVINEIDKYEIHLYRINLSHTDLEMLNEYIDIIKSSTNVPICLDSEGAQIRNQNVENGLIKFEKDTVIKLHNDEILGDCHNISFTPLGITRKFKVGDIINIDFDLTSIEVIEKSPKFCLGRVLKSGTVGSNKAVDVNRSIELESITEKDKRAFLLGKKRCINNFSLSFASTQRDVKKLRNIVGNDSNIISKIENKSGLVNLKSILDVTDEILIDRGDLSRQIPIEKIPFLQRRIISMARIYGKPSYVATNLLESMINNRSPTRAEVNDIVSTIMMGADGLVLAAETAVGKHPVSAVKIVKNTFDLCKKWTPNTNILEILDM